MSTIALMLESDGPGGAERMVLQLAEELRRRGHEVVPVGPARGCGWLAGEFRDRGFRPETFQLRFPFDPLCLAGLVSALRARRVTAVHSHEFTMAVYGAAASRLLGVPHVATMHGGIGFSDRWRRRVAFRWACRTSRAVVAVSRASAAEMEARLGLSPGTFQVIPNGIRPEHASGADFRGELSLPGATLLILAVGNLYPVKGHAVLLRALSSCGIAAHLAIAGRGEELESLAALAKELGLGGRLHLLGYRADIADLLAAADVFAMPSLSEGLPLALLEAMFAGKAIVASAVGGIPEVITDRVEGLLVPPADIGALSGAMTELLGDPELRTRLGQAAATLARSRYSIETMAASYLSLFGQAG